MNSGYTIAACMAPQQADALRVLHAGLPADQQIALVRALDAVDRRDNLVFAGLLVAVLAEELVAAAWVQLTAGQTAVVWLPADGPSAADLMQAVARFLDEHRVALAQFLIGDESSLNPELLVTVGFQKLAKLAYLTVDSHLFPTELPAAQLSFQPSASTDPQRLGELLLRTYEGSHDCPQLNGVRNSDDVLEGYRQQGTFAPDCWFFVRHEETDVGALILTAHADSGNWELVYMGLVPEARGDGWGRQILEYALWQARLGGAQRLVLAVDEANRPAYGMYQQAGFVAWDYRTVYARLRPQTRCED